MPSGPRLRAAITAIPGYRPGRVPGGGAGHKLSSNENPFPPLPSVAAAIAAAGAEINRYPDMAVGELAEAVAAHLEVAPATLAFGTGSVAVAQQLLAATVEPGDEVLFAWRSFEAYPILTRVLGGTPVPVALDATGRHDLPRMAAAITARTRAVLLCSPNNPTGPALHAGELEAFLDAVPDEVLVVLDEAYLEFVTDPAACDGLAVFRARDNVALLRTFSKAHGLAGLRVGFAVAPPAVAAAARACALPFGVGSLAQVAARASLRARGEMAVRVNAIVAERERLLGTLRAHGWTIPDAQGNFLWLPTGADSLAFAGACEAAGVMVRPFDGEGVRVSIGRPEIDEMVLAVALDWLGGGRTP